jgi:hypothetical protein
MVAGRTGDDDDIGRFIQKRSGAGIPPVTIFPAGRPNEPTLLPDLLAPDRVLAEIANAARSRQGIITAYRARIARGPEITSIALAVWPASDHWRTAS